MRVTSNLVIAASFIVLISPSCIFGYIEVQVADNEQTAQTNGKRIDVDDSETQLQSIQTLLHEAAFPLNPDENVKLHKAAFPLNTDEKVELHKAAFPLTLKKNVELHKAAIPLNPDENVELHKAAFPLNPVEKVELRRATAPKRRSKFGLSVGKLGPAIEITFRKSESNVDFKPPDWRPRHHFRNRRPSESNTNFKNNDKYGKQSLSGTRRIIGRNGILELSYDVPNKVKSPAMVQVGGERQLSFAPRTPVKRQAEIDLDQLATIRRLQWRLRRQQMMNAVLRRYVAMQRLKLDDMSEALARLKRHRQRVPKPTITQMCIAMVMLLFCTYGLLVCCERFLDACFNGRDCDAEDDDNQNTDGSDIKKNADNTHLDNVTINIPNDITYKPQNLSNLINRVCEDDQKNLGVNGLDCTRVTCPHGPSCTGVTCPRGPSCNRVTCPRGPDCIRCSGTVGSVLLGIARSRV